MEYNTEHLHSSESRKFTITEGCCARNSRVVRFPYALEEVRVRRTPLPVRCRNLMSRNCLMKRLPPAFAGLHLTSHKHGNRPCLEHRIALAFVRFHHVTDYGSAGWGFDSLAARDTAREKMRA